MEQANKCSLILTLNHAPGTLVEVLKCLAEEGCNLTKIVSRPMRHKPFEYLFYIDFECTQNGFARLLQNIERLAEQQKILGYYKEGTLWTC